MKLAAVALAVLLAGCTSGRIYFKGPPRRIDATKRASPPQLVVHAGRITGDQVRLKMRWLTEVSLTRRLHYSVAVAELRPSKNPACELGEVALGLFILPFTVGITYIDMDPPAQPDQRLEVTHLPFLAMVNPFASLLCPDIRARISDRDMFPSEPVLTRFGMRLPAAGVDADYQVLDAAAAVIASGRVRTDDFGRAELTGVAPEAAVVVVTIGKDSFAAPIGE